MSNTLNLSRWYYYKRRNDRLKDVLHTRRNRGHSDGKRRSGDELERRFVLRRNLFADERPTRGVGTRRNILQPLLPLGGPLQRRLRPISADAADDGIRGRGEVSAVVGILTWRGFIGLFLFHRFLLSAIITVRMKLTDYARCLISSARFSFYCWRIVFLFL